jgi:hypothetical protein
MKTGTASALVKGKQSRSRTVSGTCLPVPTPNAIERQAQDMNQMIDQMRDRYNQNLGFFDSLEQTIGVSVTEDSTVSVPSPSLR